MALIIQTNVLFRLNFLSKTKKLELLESKIRQIEIDYFFKAIGNLPREDSIALANLLRSLQINLEKELV